MARQIPEDDEPSISGRFQPSQIKNKRKREEMNAKLQAQKKKDKKLRIKRRNQAEEKAQALGEEVISAPFLS